ncbi:MAG: hypothetical protein WCO33_04135 [bacterium]
MVVFSPEGGAPDSRSPVKRRQRASAKSSGNVIINTDTTHPQSVVIPLERDARGTPLKHLTHAEQREQNARQDPFDRERELLIKAFGYDPNAPKEE